MLTKTFDFIKVRDALCVFLVKHKSHARIFSFFFFLLPSGDVHTILAVSQSEQRKLRRSQHIGFARRRTSEFSHQDHSGREETRHREFLFYSSHIHCMTLYIHYMIFSTRLIAERRRDQNAVTIPLHRMALSHLSVFQRHTRVQTKNEGRRRFETQPRQSHSGSLQVCFSKRATVVGSQRTLSTIIAEYFFNSDGGGRSGVYLSIDANLELAEEEDCYDVFGYLKTLRQSRKGMVETLVRPWRCKNNK